MCLLVAMLASCSPAAIQATPARSEGTLYVFRQQPPALLELSAGRTILHETPVAIPEGCSLEDIFAPPAGTTLAIEYGCSFGQAVVWIDVESGRARQPVTDSDSHFMAWNADGSSTYLKVDTMGRPRIVLAGLHGERETVPISNLVYDLTPTPGIRDEFVFSLSKGMGFGSEMWFARFGGRLTKLIASDPHSYLSFARWSPDATRVAFIKIPDSATPFTVGELWVMNADGSQARKLADSDAGHGYAEAWSPDGDRIAFVVRANPDDRQADQNADALQSNIFLYDLKAGVESQFTRFQGARVEAPAWSPDGRRLAFTVVSNDKMSVYVSDMASGEVGAPVAPLSCCPVWIRK